MGGAAAYAAVTAARLGLRAAIISNPHAQLDIAAALPDVSLHLTDAPATTTFSNQATATGREQRWFGECRTLDAASVPAAWRNTPLVLLAPVAQEVDPAVAALFPTSVLGVCPQGWMRARDEQGLVHATGWRNAEQALGFTTLVALSEEDLPPNSLEDQPALLQAPILAVTQGAAGAQLWHEGRWEHVPSYPTRVVDTTGAGDVFAAALLCEYARTRSVGEAGKFASAAASLSIQGRGLSAIPTRAAIETRLGAPRGGG